ncbi:MAG: hypothetical protein IPL61_15320 [Myxococcales bacterium]|nr:hypothetical protein [Myxococcales bacterium]
MDPPARRREDPDRRGRAIGIRRLASPAIAARADERGAPAMNAARADRGAPADRGARDHFASIFFSEQSTLHRSFRKIAFDILAAED